MMSVIANIEAVVSFLKKIVPKMLIVDTCICIAGGGLIVMYDSIKNSTLSRTDVVLILVCLIIALYAILYRLVKRTNSSGGRPERNERYYSSSVPVNGRVFGIYTKPPKSARPFRKDYN